MTIFVHTLDEMLTALSTPTNRALTFQNKEDAVRYAGVAYLLEMEKRARAQHPHAKFMFILDCGSEGALALHAVRLGARHLRVNAASPAYSRIASICKKAGVTLHP